MRPARHVASDAARKRASWRYIYHGAPVPEKLQYRAVPEFDWRCAAARRGEGSSTVVGSSSGIVKRRREEAELDGYDPVAFSKSFSGEDWVREGSPKAEVLAMLCKRTTAEEAEIEARRRRDEGLDELLLEQGLSAERAAREKRDEWCRITEEQEKHFVDLGSDEE